MNHFTLAQKQALEALCESGYFVAEVAYDPTQVVGTPEADAVAAGWSQYYREDNPTLVEVIYTKLGSGQPVQVSQPEPPLGP